MTSPERWNLIERLTKLAEHMEHEAATYHARAYQMGLSEYAIASSCRIEQAYRRRAETVREAIEVITSHPAEGENAND